MNIFYVSYNDVSFSVSICLEKYHAFVQNICNSVKKYVSTLIHPRGWISQNRVQVHVNQRQKVQLVYWLLVAEKNAKLTKRKCHNFFFFFFK